MRALIVDGYNALHAWPNLRDFMAKNQIEVGRNRLVAMLADYAAASGVEVTVVFDSHHRQGAEQVTKVDGITVRYGTASATADNVIERMAYKVTRGGLAHDVIVATSDRLQRELVIAMGVGVMTTLELCAEVQGTARLTNDDIATRRTEADFSHRVEDHLDAGLREQLEQLRRGNSITPDGDAKDD